MNKKQIIATGLVLALVTPAAAADGKKSKKDDARKAAAQPLSPLEIPADQPLTLGDALAVAMSNSPRLEMARAGVAAAQARKRGAKAEGMPSLGVNTSGQFQGPVPAGPFGDLNPPRSGQGNLDLNIPLFTGGRVKAGKKGAKAAEVAALAQQEQVAQQLVLDVTGAYLDSMEALQRIRLTRALRALNEERLRVARVRAAAQITDPVVVTQNEADLAVSVQGEIEAQARYQQSLATLNTLMGRPAAAKVVLAVPAEADVVLVGSGEKTEPLSPEKAREMGLARPDLQALRAQVVEAEAGVDAARAARRPFASITGNLLRRLPETLLGGWAWTLGGSIIQTLFDGGRSRAQVEAARAERLRAGASLSENERRVEEIVEQTRVEAEAAERRLEAEDKRVAAAEANLRVTRQRFQNGLIAAVEVTEAETVLTRAQTDANSARFNLARARARLAYATGTAYPNTVTQVAQAR